MFEKYLTPTSLLIPICVLAIGLLPLPTPYYMLVKWVVFIFSGMAFLSLPRVMQKERIATLVLAIIYNPIFPIYFGTRLIWWPINAVALYIFWKFRNDVSNGRWSEWWHDRGNCWVLLTALIDMNTTKTNINVGTVVRKRSNKPFSDGSKTATVRDIVLNPHSNKEAFAFEEHDTLVDTFQCRVVDWIT